MTNNKEKEHHEKRDLELQNIAGNLLVAEYQVEKLKDRLVDKIRARYTFAIDKGLSTHMFKHNDNWIRISLNVEEIIVDKARDSIIGPW